MERKILTIDSQALTAYQRCPRRYYFSYVKHIEKKVKTRALEFGKVVHDLFEYVNTGLLEGKEFRVIILEAITANDRELSNLGDETKMFIIKRFMEYFQHWEIENSRYEIVAAEKGFSKELYSDDEYIFIYEGRIDALFWHNRENCYVWRDYKTTVGHQLYKHTNQFIGYTWAIGQKARGEIDYIGKQKDKTDKTFHRELVTFKNEQIERWKERAIRTCKQIVNDTAFHENQSACPGMYGVCQFHKLCERDPLIHPQIMKIDYKEKEKWSAW